MHLTRRTAIASMLAAAVAPVLAQSPTPVTVPSRGFNLPDWLAEDPRVPATGTLRRLRDLGFETIRLPIDPGLVSPAMLPRIAHVLDRATSFGFNAILDIHPGASDAETLIAAWTTLGPLLADTDPGRLYPELLNEPAFEATDFAPLRDRLAAIVRTHAPNHTIIWGPARYQGIWELDSIPPLDDLNQIVAIHYYSPMAFTHQCESWGNSPLERIGHLPFPATRDDPRVEAVAASLSDSDQAVLDDALLADWTLAQIDADFATAGDWSRRTGIPVMLGEFGVLDFCVDQVSRATWIRAVREAAEANNIGWAYWELDDGFGFISSRADDATFDHSIIAALLA
jgi:endoglucanase